MAKKINMLKDLYMKQVAIAANMEDTLIKFKNVNYSAGTQASESVVGVCSTHRNYSEVPGQVVAPRYHSFPLIS